MRNEYCLEHIDQIIESCGLSDRTTRELRQVMEFRSKHGEISSLSNGALMPLIRIKDPESQSKAIEAVVKELESRTGARVTAEKVKKRVQDVVGPKTAPPNQAAVEDEKKSESEPTVAAPVQEPERHEILPLLTPAASAVFSSISPSLRANLIVSHVL